MHTSYKELNNGIARKEGISNHEQNAVPVTKPRQSSAKQPSNRDPMIQNKMNREQEQNHGIE
jgi:hypothetical protein